MLSMPQALRRIQANVADALPERTLQQLVAGLSRTYHHRTLTPVVTKAIASKPRSHCSRGGLTASRGRRMILRENGTPTRR